MKNGFASIKVYLSPTGTVTTEYGAVDEFHRHGHHGIDLACRIGEQLHSPINGVVSKIVNQPHGLGHGIFIKTDAGYQFIFGHLSSISAKVGDVIHTGEVFGECGCSGRSYGSHLHIGVKDSLGHYVDPTRAFEHVRAMLSKIGDVAVEVYVTVKEIPVLDLFKEVVEVAASI